jgi:ABC-2 type transport system ATP-binding protein
MPKDLSTYGLTLTPEGTELTYTYDTQSDHTGIAALLRDLNAAGIEFRDLSTTQSSLEDIFVDLVRQRR